MTNEDFLKMLTDHIHTAFNDLMDAYEKHPDDYKYLNRQVNNLIKQTDDLSYFLQMELRK